MFNDRFAGSTKRDSIGIQYSIFLLDVHSTLDVCGPNLLFPLLSRVVGFRVPQMLSYRYEYVKSHSEVQRLILGRYFLYQV